MWPQCPISARLIGDLSDTRAALGHPDLFWWKQGSQTCSPGQGRPWCWETQGHSLKSPSTGLHSRLQKQAAAAGVLVIRVLAAGCRAPWSLRPLLGAPRSSRLLPASVSRLCQHGITSCCPCSTKSVPPCSPAPLAPLSTATFIRTRKGSAHRCPGPVCLTGATLLCAQHTSPKTCPKSMRRRHPGAVQPDLTRLPATQPADLTLGCREVGTQRTSSPPWPSRALPPLLPGAW